MVGTNEGLQNPEERIAALEQQIADLTARLEAVTTENETLKAENAELRGEEPVVVEDQETTDADKETAVVAEKEDKKESKTKKVIAVVALGAIALGAAIGIAKLTDSDDRESRRAMPAATASATATVTTSPTATASPEVRKGGPSDAEKEAEAKAAAEKAEAAKRAETLGKNLDGIFTGTYVTGDEVDFNLGAQERGAAAYSRETVNEDEIAAFINAGNERSRAFRAGLVESLKNDPEALKRALAGNIYDGKNAGYLAVQTKEASVIEGNTFFVNGKVLTAEKRTVGENDIFWVFVDENGDIVENASFRADCGNRVVLKVTPQKPTTPTDIPDIEQPPVEKPTPKPTPTKPTATPTPTPTTPPTQSPTPTPTPTPSETVPPKNDDGKLPKVPGADPAEDDKGTPDVAGEGPAGQSPNPDGYLPQEPKKTQAPYSPKPAPERTQAPAEPKPADTTKPVGTPENPATGEPQPSTAPVELPTVPVSDRDETPIAPMGAVGLLGLAAYRNKDSISYTLRNGKIVRK